MGGGCKWFLPLDVAGTLHKATRKLVVRKSFKSNQVGTIRPGQYVEVVEEKDTSGRIVSYTKFNEEVVAMEGWIDLTCWDRSDKAMVACVKEVEFRATGTLYEATRKLVVRKSFESDYVGTIQEGELVEVVETKRKYPMSKTKTDTRVRIVSRTTLNGEVLPMEGWTDLTCWDRSDKAVVECMKTIEKTVPAPEKVRKPKTKQTKDDSEGPFRDCVRSRRKRKHKGKARKKTKKAGKR